MGRNSLNARLCTAWLRDAQRTRVTEAFINSEKMTCGFLGEMAGRNLGWGR